MELAGLDSFNGQPIKAVKKEDNSLVLSFDKKILFIHKEISFRIKADESLDRLAVKAVEGATMKSASAEGAYIKFELVPVSGPVFHLAFKSSAVEKL
jgi:hypothetical protein